MQQLIKYTGSKRYQAAEIIKHIPKNGKTYYEPFLGSGSIFYAILENRYNYESFVLSDINKDVIELHKYLLFGDLEEILEDYETHRENLLNNKPDYYYQVRLNFNKYRLSSDFLFLNRNCANGVIRYNKKNEFNSPFHHNRDGIITKNLEKIILFYRELIVGRRIEFLTVDFKSYSPSNNDFIYLDPPYSNSSKLYGSFVISQSIAEFIKNLKCSWGLSYNGVRGENDFELDLGLHSYKFLIENGKSSFDRLFNKKQSKISEYYYTNVNS